MRIKKILSMLLCAALLGGVLCACGGQGAESKPKGEVNVYNWGEYIDEELLAQFEQETGIHVNYTNYEHNEAMYSKIKQGGVNYDVVIPSDYMISRMIQEDMLEEINFDNVPNFANIMEEYRNPDYDPTNAYSVPYAGGVVGIIYNSTVVTEPVTSWEIMFSDQYAGEVLMIDNSRDAFGIALKYLGYSQNTTNADEIQAACDLIADAQARGVYKGYVMDQVFDKMESGEAAISAYYAGDYLTMVENNPDLKFAIPEEGSNQFMDAMCILKGAANKENAEAFINFMCDVDVATQNAEYIWYTSPVKGVRENLELDEETDAVMYPDPAILEKCEFFIHLPQETLDLYSDLWVKLKV